MRVFCVLILSFLLSSGAHAACNKASLKGLFAGTGAFSTSSVAAGVFYFNGKGKITVRSLYESIQGSTYRLTGSGTYTVNKNCSGTIRFVGRYQGMEVGSAVVYFGLGGTKNLPEILGVYENASDGVSGAFRLVRSRQ